MADDPAHVANLYLRALLSSGEFSSVFVAQHNTDDELVVVKSFNRAHLHSSPQLLYRMMRERHAFDVTSQLPHPFVVSFRFALLDTAFAYLGMEHVGGGDLFTRLMTAGPLAPHAARVYVCEICLALGHLHSFDFMYRDLKPENVVIALDGHLKLADFGSAKRMLGRLPDAPPPATEHSLCGTPEYMAPETLRSHPACEMVDMWGLGCLSTELLAGVTPFARGDELDVPSLIRRILHDPLTLPVHAHLGPLEHSFLSALLERDPALRLGARPRGHVAVLEHPWLAGLSAQQVLTKQVHAPWVPLLNGPRPEHEPPPPPTAEMLQQADNHAKGAHLAPFAPIPAPGDALAAWAPVLLDGPGVAAGPAAVAPGAAARDMERAVDANDDDGRNFISPISVTSSSEQLQQAPHAAADLAARGCSPASAHASGFVRAPGSAVSAFGMIDTLSVARS